MPTSSWTVVVGQPAAATSIARDFWGTTWRRIADEDRATGIVDTGEGGAFSKRILFWEHYKAVNPNAEETFNGAWISEMYCC